MPFIVPGTVLFHGSQGRGSLRFSHSSVIGNLVTVLNLKFWHSRGAAIHLLARHTARGFSRNPLIVLNTNNIYIHCDETKFTAGFWGWLQDSLIPRTSTHSPARRPEFSQIVLQPRAHRLPFLEWPLIYRVCPLANRSPVLSPSVLSPFYSPRSI